ncbi:hypothetical protein G6F16_000029 [Rhizopus arrhizus]|nr:hypothetical protein G6F16_000029 [Rhizopus arrhizus]
MGGIIARFAIGILDRQDIFKNITLMSYTSFASPHLGGYIPHDAWYGYVINNMMKRAGSPATDQITFSDTFRDGKPLFEILANPEYEFYTALSKFKYRRSYANTMGDFNVAYYTSALDSFDYFDDSNMEITCDPKYPSIVTKFDQIKPVQHKTTAIRLLFTMLICVSVPIVIVWSKIKYWRVHDEILLKYKDEQDGYYSIHIDQEKGAFLFRERQKNEKEMIQEPKFKGLFNPLPGPNLENRVDYELKCLPVQLEILKNLKQLTWDIVLVRINSLKSHRMIMGMDIDIQEGQDLLFFLIDGISDVAIPELDFKTPLQVARTPWMDKLADITEEEARLKSNFAYLEKETGIVKLRKADSHFGNLGPAFCEAVNNIKLPSFPEHEIVVQYAIEHRCGVRVRGPRITDTITGTDPLKDNKLLIYCEPTVDNEDSRMTSKLVNELSDAFISILSEHPLNKDRIKQGKNPANSPTCIIAGIGMTLGMDLLKVPGATGDYSSDFNAKAQSCIKNITSNEYDFGFCHLKAVDEAGHDKDVTKKIYYLERIDEMIGLVLQELNQRLDESYTVVVTGDHTTPALYGDHSCEPVPFCLPKEA